MSRVWDLFVELRKETIEAQRIRAQVIGFKITFVSAAIGYILQSDNPKPALWAIPAFAAIGFDYLIYSYSFSIKRIGAYIRDHVEPALLTSGTLPATFVTWEQYLKEPQRKQRYSHYGNLLITCLTAAFALAMLWDAHHPAVSALLVLLLPALMVLDVIAMQAPNRFARDTASRQETTRETGGTSQD